MNVWTLATNVETLEVHVVVDPWTPAHAAVRTLCQRVVATAVESDTDSTITCDDCLEALRVHAEWISEAIDGVAP